MDTFLQGGAHYLRKEGANMKDKKTNLPPVEPSHEEFGDNNIPEIDLPKPSYVTDVIPDEVPRRDGPGGE